ncbi:hypothetical protein L596_023588 [Steinernema carpocapsae]|uniref:Uncharacterized protein n=1 Tax=Steinernema carpocapsae TaxID=34508 RepID=A0A4U5ME40_STECR|nr:hypothetical protein L596_023588 [Steinernema carpocapsae]
MGYSRPQPPPQAPEGMPGTASQFMPPPPMMGMPPMPPIPPMSQLNPLAVAAAAHGHSNPISAMQDPKVMSTTIQILTQMRIQQMVNLSPEIQQNPAFPAYVSHMMQQIQQNMAGYGALNMPHHPGAGQHHSNGPNHSMQNDEMPQQSPRVPSNLLPTSVLRNMNKAAAQPIPKRRVPRDPRPPAPWSAYRPIAPRSRPPSPTVTAITATVPKTGWNLNT